MDHANIDIFINYSYRLDRVLLIIYKNNNQIKSVCRCVYPA